MQNMAGYGFAFLWATFLVAVGIVILIWPRLPSSADQLKAYFTWKEKENVDDHQEEDDQNK
jgi:hypothetical protein